MSHRSDVVSQETIMAILRNYTPGHVTYYSGWVMDRDALFIIGRCGTRAFRTYIEGVKFLRQKYIIEEVDRVLKHGVWCAGGLAE